MGGDIVAPDDLVFDDAGNLYLTEITKGRVCMREPNGRVQVIQGGSNDRWELRRRTTARSSSATGFTAII